jgi:hypothetical protein
VGRSGGSSWVGVGRGVRSGHDVGASRNAGGGYRGSCSVLLVCDQGGQYADEGHGDRQKDQQEFIRTCPKKMHLTPPRSISAKTTRYTRKRNQICLNEVLSAQRGKLNHEPATRNGRRYGGMRRPLPIVLPRPDRTFQGKLSISRRQPRGTYRMNEPSRQTTPAAPTDNPRHASRDGSRDDSRLPTSGVSVLALVRDGDSEIACGAFALASACEVWDCN